MDLTFISLLQVPSKWLSCSVRTACQCKHPICIFTASRDWTRLLDWDQSCSKLSADDLGSRDAPRCDRTIQDNPSTFQQALYASFSYSRSSQADAMKAREVDGKEDHSGDRLHPALLGSGNSWL